MTQWKAYCQDCKEQYPRIAQFPPASWYAIGEGETAKEALETLCVRAMTWDDHNHIIKLEKTHEHTFKCTECGEAVKP